MFGWGDPFDYFECPDCGCLQIDQCPDDLARYYPPEYYSLGVTPDPHPGRSRRWLNWQRLSYRLTGRWALAESMAWRFGPLDHAILRQLPYLTRLHRLSGLHRHLQFLDVGCGNHSLWLDSLARSGFSRLTGIDPYLDKQGTRGGVLYLRSTLEDLTGIYDCITFHHSLEHLPDQHAAMDAVARHLAPGGVCLIRIPLWDSLVAERYGMDWVELDAPRHLYLHTRASMIRLASAHGFVIAETLCDSTAFEFAGSEQYRSGVALMAPESFWVRTDGGTFTSDQMRTFNDLARVANDSGRCGRAAFFLKRAHSE